MKELLELTKENNEMLRYIVSYINYERNDGNMHDFFSNIAANLFADRMYLGGRSS